MTLLDEADLDLGARPARRSGRRLPAWPLTGVLLLYPVWWGLGLGVLVFYLAAVPMAILLVRRWTSGRTVLTPPGFLVWLVFLATVLAGLFALGADPRIRTARCRARRPAGWSPTGSGWAGTSR
jgi:hypothetical protein